MSEVKTYAVTRTVYDIEDIVNRLDPNRNDPELAYEFSNGRKFYTIKEYSSIDAEE